MASLPLTNSSDQFKLFDVYLSFSRSDARSSFVVHLDWALKDQGMRVFVRDVDSEGRDEIDGAISRAREESKSSVIIFSEGYIGSTWCLDELVEIMKLRAVGNSSVIPVFYGIDPVDLDEQTGPIKTAFRRFEAREDQKKMRMWRDALRSAFYLYGWIAIDIRNEATLIQEIVKDIWKLLMVPSCLTNPTQRTYDVYVSFRGCDTRSTFLGHLCHAFMAQGISVFIDTSGLKRGDMISGALLRALEESRIFLIIFSKNYLKSRWCLDELAKIMELRTAKQCLVFRVFYVLDPLDVDDARGPVALAFEKHIANGMNPDRVQNWRAAFYKASSLPGWDSTCTSNDANLIQSIVETIWNKLDKPSQSSSVEIASASFESGVVNSHIDKIMSLLQMTSSDVRVIGILGEGGIGKTTIAKELFRRVWDMFQKFYFFTNIKEEVKRSSVGHLRKKLRLGSIDEESSNSKAPSLGLAFKKDQVHRLKVLLILDDVDDPADVQELVTDRIELFGAGSRILITSRNSFALKNLDAIYKVEKINEEDSEKLFRLFALKRSFALKRRHSLPKILKQVDGNPLAIRVLGSTLHEKSDSEWDSALEKLEKLPVSVHKVLRYSYDTLTEEEKKAFLDVACFFVGENWDDVARILDDHHSSVRIILRTLVNRSLISNSNMRLQMHDLLQEMAWTIVREEISTEPGRRSNLWNPENLYHLLNKQKGWMMLGCSSSLCLISL